MKIIKTLIKSFFNTVGFVLFLELFLLSMMHVISLLVSERILSYFNIYIENSIWNLVYLIVLTSFFSFLLTLIAHFMLKALKKYDYFIFFFSVSNILNTYIWGLITLILLAKPYFISENIYIASEFPSDENTLAFGLLFFVTLTNNTIFKNLIIDKEYKPIGRVLKEILVAIRG